MSSPTSTPAILSLAVLYEAKGVRPLCDLWQENELETSLGTRIVPYM